MTDPRAHRRLAAILAADVVGYSRLMGADEGGTLAALRARWKDVLTPAVARHRGRVVKVMGDGVLVEFGSAVDAVECAVAVQAGFAAANAGVAEDRRIMLRVGINLGDVIVQGGDLYGDGVNIAARLEGAAEPGGICVSAKVMAEVEGKARVGFADMGERVLKNIATPLRVFGVTLSDRPSAGTSERRPAHDKPSIAVLPFVNMSGGDENEYFADGLTEDIITALSRSATLSVIARTSSFAYKGKTADIKRIATELDAVYILEGSVRRSGNRLRVTAQLIDATTGVHLWAEKFDGLADDAFDIQDQITRSVAASAHIQIFAAPDRSQRALEMIGSPAYQLSLQAMAQMFEMTSEAFAKCAALAERALALDPDCAHAHLMRGIAFVLRLATGDIPHSPENIDRVLQLAAETVRRAARNEWSHWLMAFALAEAGRFEQAVAEYDAGLALNPNAAVILADKGDSLTMLGRPDESLPLIELALRLNPRDPTAYWMETGIATAHLIAGDAAQAMELAWRIALRKPEHIRAGIIWAASAGLLGRHDNAATALQHCLARVPGLTLSNVMPHYFPRFHRAQDRNLLIRGLQLAGMPP
jgi:TolB-like protein